MEGRRGEGGGEEGFSTVGVTYQTVCTSWVGEKVLQDGAVNMVSPEPFLQ